MPVRAARVRTKDPDLFINRELSWLAFNYRVLEEAMDVTVPLLDRLKFAIIVSTNLDEFFMVRVAGLKNAVQEGDVLICPVTAPSWAPVFPKIKAAVCDVGGLMAHAAIVAREYGLPAVVGTGIGTKTIETGQTVEVDGTNGIVRVLS